MATSYTTLLGLALPVTGELSGTWGTTVNTGLTQLAEDAIAGTTTLSSDADVTLTDTDGASNQARAAILLWTASGSVTRNITAPAQSKVYIVINATGGSQSIVLRGAGPTAGITIAATEKCVASWNGSDFIKVASTVTGTTAIANGGTGQTTATAAFDALAPTTTTGDLIYYNGTDNIRLAIGATNKVLTVAGGVPTWADAPGGSMVYPDAGVAISTGTAWDTSKTNPTGAFVGTTDSQTLTNKTLSTGSTWNGNAVGVLYGGTGATTATAAFNALSPLTTQGDVLYHNGTNNVRLAKGTALQVLRMNSGATAPEWSTANSGTVTSVALSGGTTGLTVSGSPITTSGTITLAGTLAIASGGTGQTTATAAFDALAPTTTAGDTIYHNGTDNVRLALGATAKFIKSTGSAPSWEYVTPGVLASETHGTAVNIQYASGTGASGNITITGDAASSGNVTGGAVNITGGAGVGTGAGAGVVITGGAGGASGTGGGVSIVSGAGGSTTASGGITIAVGASGTGVTGGVLSLAAGNAAADGGALTIAAGSCTSSGTGGALQMYGGDSASGAGGAIELRAGNATGAFNAGGDVIIVSGTSGGSEPGGDIYLSVGGGSSNGAVYFENCNVANGAVATAMSSVGPTGANTTIQGWLRVKVNGTVRYIPFW